RRQRWRVRLVFEGDARGQVDPNTVDVVSAGADGDRAAVGADLEAGVAFGRAGPADDVDPGLASVEQLDVRLLVQVGVGHHPSLLMPDAGEIVPWVEGGAGDIAVHDSALVPQARL